MSSESQREMFVFSEQQEIVIYLVLTESVKLLTGECCFRVYKTYLRCIKCLSWFRRHLEKLGGKNVKGCLSQKDHFQLCKSKLHTSGTLGNFLQKHVFPAVFFAINIWYQLLL